MQAALKNFLKIFFGEKIRRNFLRFEKPGKRGENALFRQEKYRVCPGNVSLCKLHKNGYRFLVIMMNCKSR